MSENEPTIMDTSMREESLGLMTSVHVFAPAFYELAPSPAFFTPFPPHLYPPLLSDSAFNTSIRVKPL